LKISSVTSKSTFETTEMDSVGLLINLGILGLMTHAGIETE